MSAPYRPEMRAWQPLRWIIRLYLFFGQCSQENLPCPECQAPSTITGHLIERIRHEKHRFTYLYSWISNEHWLY